jgi:hypothetical protein
MATLGSLVNELSATLGKVEQFDPANQSAGYVVDIGARLNALRARAEALADLYKARLWEIAPAKQGGIIPGDTFAAVLQISPAPRIDVKALRETHPRIAARFTVDDGQPRVTFKPRG